MTIVIRITCACQDTSYYCIRGGTKRLQRLSKVPRSSRTWHQDGDFGGLGDSDRDYYICLDHSDDGHSYLDNSDDDSGCLDGGDGNAYGLGDGDGDEVVIVLWCMFELDKCNTSHHQIVIWISSNSVLVIYLANSTKITTNTEILSSLNLLMVKNIEAGGIASEFNHYV